MPSRPPGGRSILLLTALGALALALVYTFYFVFSRSMSLDEGYLMITIQGFNSGHALYDSVFTQYGPFYYFYEWLLRGLAGIPLTHDATRLLCLAHWLLAAGVLGGAAWQMTRSAFAALFVALQAVVHLSTIANEPGHPQEIIVVLLAAGILLANRISSNRWALEIVVLVAAVLAFTKINIGAFFVFAALLTMRCFSPDRFARGIWNWLLLAGITALPWLLMRQHLSAEWCRNLAVVMTCAVATSLAVVQHARNESMFTTKHYLRVTAAFGIACVVLLGATLATGTSVRGLLDGLVLTPMKMPRFALLPLAVTGPAVLCALASVAVAGLAIWRRDHPGVTTLLTWLKGAYAIAGALCLLGEPKSQITFLIPWVWLVAIRTADTKPHESFARTFLCLAAAWQSLQIYPIAGTQVTLATFLLVLSYGVCLADALRAASVVPQWTELRGRLTPATRTLAWAFSSAALLCLFANFWCKLPDVRREYARLLPLELPGSRFIRMDEEIATMNQQLARYLTSECDTFVSYPGINSLYFWTGKTPPTQINSTGWGQLTHAQQKQILNSLLQAPRPKLVVTEALMKGWDTPYADPIRPLVRFVTEDCRPVKRIGRCLIFEPKPAAQLSARQ